MNGQTKSGRLLSLSRCSFALLFTGVSALSAHDASEITAKARVQADRIEVEFTMAYVTALHLVSPARESASTSPKKFPEIKPVLETRAPALVALVTGDQLVAARKFGVELTRDDEIRFQFEFAVGSTAGAIRLDALLLQILAADQYHCLLTIYGPGKNQIRYEALRLGKRACELLTPGG